MHYLKKYKGEIKNVENYEFKRKKRNNNISFISNNNNITNIGRLPYIFEYTTINENHVQFEYVAFLMYNSNMAKKRLSLVSKRAIGRLLIVLHI